MVVPRSALNILRGVVTKNSPFYIQYYIIAQCHLACRMCNIVEANSDLVPASLDDVGKIAGNLREIGAGVVLLTGGEPFLHKNIDEIVKLFVKEGLSPRLQTAGLATREQLQKCYDNGARHINVSLDSLVEEKQDYLNGSKKGSWREAIRALSDINAVFHSRRRLCALGCVLSKQNYKEIPALLEFATRIGWWLSLVPVHITSLSEPRNFQGTDPQFTFNEGEYGELDGLLEKLLEMRRTHLLFDSERFLRSAINYLKTGVVTWRSLNGNVCDSPNLYFAVLPNGDFAVCCDHRYQQGLNVADPRFPVVYRSRDFRNSVHKITSRCGGCNYGSYPEVSLFARDKKVLFERATFMMGRKNRAVPQLTYEQILAIAEEIREKYKLSPFVKESDDRPPAASQRYAGPKILTRREAVLEWVANSPKRFKVA